MDREEGTASWVLRVCIYILPALLFLLLGRPETTYEVLKSIMDISLYRKKIEDLKQHVTDPANFTDNLYQPDRDSSGKLIHHREDHNHLLNVSYLVFAKAIFQALICNI